MLKTGYNELDNLINGLNGGELITIAGRPCMFKSTFCINIINNISKCIDKKILYFNFESSKEILNKRINSIKVEIIGSTPIEDIKNMCYENKQELSLVVIDYLQLVESCESFSNRNEEASYISNILKSIALDLDIPIIVVSNLSRNIDERNDKRPILDDIGTTGIQQDSDKIICLYSDDRYDEQLFHRINSLDLIVVKNRGGNLGTIKLLLNNGIPTFK